MKAGLPQPNLELTAEILREEFDYDPEQGLFRQRKKKTHRTNTEWRKGAGYEGGYRVLKVLGRMYLAHRLAWLHHHGKWPDCVIDHINGVRDDNRIANLRDVSWQENQRARRAKEKSESVKQ